MNKFTKASTTPASAASLKQKFGHQHPDIPEEAWEAQAARLNAAEYWLNDIYQVEIDYKPNAPEGVKLVHLSIKRIDKQPCKNWRHFQIIKNELVGPECEAVEIYPAESRLVDSANQYHLWVFSDPEQTIPFGFVDRLVMDGTGVIDPVTGTCQEPFDYKEPGLKPNNFCSCGSGRKYKKCCGKKIEGSNDAI